MNKAKLIVIALVASFATSALASDIEFHGYTRIGVALNSSGGTGMCFHLAGADTDYRLGNECDYVIEPNFEITMAKLDDKSTWGFHIMPSVYKRWQPMGGREFDSLTVKFGQVYFFGNNIPWLANGSIWVGRKFWDRLQLGINDQFIEREDSESFGVENMDLGVAKLSIGVGLMADGACDAGSQTCPVPAVDSGGDTLPIGDGYNLDTASLGSRRYRIAARLTGIQTMNKDSSLQIWAAYYGQYRNDDLAGEIETGYRIGVYHNFGFGSAGNLFVGAKYHKDDAIAGMDGDADGRTQWRVFGQYGVAVPSIRTSIDVLAEYRSSEVNIGANEGDVDTWMTVGARADAQLSGPFRFLLEVGYDRVDGDSFAEAASLLKITPVLAISAGNDPWSRPTFRLYYTYASWSDPGVLDGWSSHGAQDVYGADATSGSSFGVQAEGWW